MNCIEYQPLFFTINKGNHSLIDDCHIVGKRKRHNMARVITEDKMGGGLLKALCYKLQVSGGSHYAKFVACKALNLVTCNLQQILI